MNRGRPKGCKPCTVDHVPVKVYFTLQEIMQLTGLSRYLVLGILDAEKVRYHKYPGSRIRVYKRIVYKYFNVRDEF